MDTARMLEKCVRDQWRIDDLDWSLAPPQLPRDKEEAVCQYFTDMAGIELLAGALFEVQRDRTDDPTMAKIFATFVADEKRHAAVAARLAQHYDVHHYRVYRESEALVNFRPAFLRVVEKVQPEFANAYITGGELILDVALLRSLDAYVADEMSHRAMALINRDESRHIAVDFHMTEYYASEAYLAKPKAKSGSGLADLARMMWLAKPFLVEIFLTPMDKTDPSGKRVADALKRMQLLMRKPRVAQQPLARFMRAMQFAYNAPIVGTLFGPLLLRALGADPRAARYLFTAEELARSQRQSFDELAEEALAAKGVS